jgi:hypothetical protein
LKGKP